MPDSQYNVNITISAKDQTSQPAKSATSALNQLKKAAQFAAVAYATLKTAQLAVDFVRAGAEVMRQETALNSLAVAAGTTADEIVTAIEFASAHTINRMTAMSVANRALVMEVAKTPEQFAKLTETAVVLGRAMGMDAVASIDRFVLAIGRQSRLIADDFGLLVSAETAYEKYAKSIGKAADALTLEEQKLAFGQEMMAQAATKVAALGGVTIDAAGKMEQLSATVKNAKTDLSELAAQSLDSAGVLDWLNERVGGLAHTFFALGSMASGAWAAMGAFAAGGDAAAAMEAFNAAVKKSVEVQAALDAEIKTVMPTELAQASLFTQLGRVAVPEVTAAEIALASAIRAKDEALLASLGLVAGTPPVYQGHAAAARDAGRAEAEFGAGLNIATAAMWLRKAEAEQKVIWDEEAKVAAEEAAEADRAYAAEMEALRMEIVAADIEQQNLNATLMDAGPAQVAAAMINMVSASYQAGSISSATYQAAVQSLQLQFNITTPATVALVKAMGALNTALEGGEVDSDALGAELAGLAEFQRQQAEAALNSARATAGASTATATATKAAREHEAALREEQRALEATERAAQRKAEAYWTLSQRLKEAYKEQIAGIYIDKLTTAMEAGELGIEKYNRAVQQLLLGFGLATPESMQLATGLDVLLDAFAGGDMKSRDLVAALEALIGSTTRATSNTYNINDAGTGALLLAREKARAQRAFLTSSGM